MQSLKSFIKRNAPVFFLGFIITLVFLTIILAQPKVENNIPAGFIKVEETIFEGGVPKEPEESPTGFGEYATQVFNPENKGKPYFYGEKNPNLRDKDGYPVPPSPETVEISNSLSLEDRIDLKQIVQETYIQRTSTVIIKYTSGGFDPTDIIAYTGQKIVWTNTSNITITINQTLSIHEALKGGITLKPGESTTFRPLINGTFTYLEVGSGKYGSITVIDSTAPLQ